MKKPGLFFIVATFLLAACTGNSRASSAFDNDGDISTTHSHSDFSFKKIQVNDSTGCRNVNGETTREVAIYMTIDLPTSNNRISNVVSDWIAEQLGISSLSTSSLKSFARNYVTENRAYDEEYGGLREDSIKCTLATDKVVAYEFDTNEQLGMGWGYDKKGIAFDVASGTPLTWDIVQPSKKQQFVKLFLNELAKSQSANGTITAEGINFVKENFGTESNLPPIFAKKGIICYIQASRNMSAEFTLPYDALRDIVTPQTAALFPGN